MLLSCLLCFSFFPLPADLMVCELCVWKSPCHCVENVGQAQLDVDDCTHLVDDGIACCRTVRTLIFYRMALQYATSSPHRNLHRNPLRNLHRNPRQNQLQNPRQNQLQNQLQNPLRNLLRNLLQHQHQNPHRNPRQNQLQNQLQNQHHRIRPITRLVLCTTVP